MSAAKGPRILCHGVLASRNCHNLWKVWRHMRSKRTLSVCLALCQKSVQNLSSILVTLKTGSLWCVRNIETTEIGHCPTFDRQLFARIVRVAFMCGMDRPYASTPYDITGHTPVFANRLVFTPHLRRVAVRLALLAAAERLAFITSVALRTPAVASTPRSFTEAS